MTANFREIERTSWSDESAIDYYSIYTLHNLFFCLKTWWLLTVARRRTYTRLSWNLQIRKNSLNPKDNRACVHFIRLSGDILPSSHDWPFFVTRRKRIAELVNSSEISVEEVLFRGRNAIFPNLFYSKPSFGFFFWKSHVLPPPISLQLDLDRTVRAQTLPVSTFDRQRTVQSSTTSSSPRPHLYLLLSCARRSVYRYYSNLFIVFNFIQVVNTSTLDILTKNPILVLSTHH